MAFEDAIIIGGGPCGMQAAISLQEIGKSPLIIEKGNIVNAIYHYPTHQTFFSTSEKLEIGDVAFITQNRKPVRLQALTYYREVAKRKELRVNTFERVLSAVKREDGLFKVTTEKGEYETPYVILATGYYDQPNMLGIPGEELDKVYHYFKEGHPYYNQDVVVIGGKNSSIDAAMELAMAGARVTVIYRGSVYSSSIKPWILPEFESLVRHGKIKMEFNAQVQEIKPESVIYVQEGKSFEIKNDFVFAMIGYHPDFNFLRECGIQYDEESGKPVIDVETMETNVENLYIAGVIAAGRNANEIFIENGRFHGGQIARSIAEKEQKQ
ncbi:YpdA family putative bacillithiol disulfide reductase [Pradoshia sp.]|uniref:YpdA family putative bacillithiol disulfide reductase n=1 Tax=Pradoshia sp. TaxID=2651281 RepID=UPI003F0F8974